MARTGEAVENWRLKDAMSSAVLGVGGISRKMREATRAAVM